MLKFIKIYIIIKYIIYNRLFCMLIVYILLLMWVFDLFLMFMNFINLIYFILMIYFKGIYIKMLNM